jgi:hypothetical protein
MKTHLKSLSYIYTNSIKNLKHLKHCMVLFITATEYTHIKFGILWYIILLLKLNNNNNDMTCKLQPTLQDETRVL